MQKPSKQTFVIIHVIDLKILPLNQPILKIPNFVLMADFLCSSVKFQSYTHTYAAMNASNLIWILIGGTLRFWNHYATYEWMLITTVENYTISFMYLHLYQTNKKYVCIKFFVFWKHIKCNKANKKENIKIKMISNKRNNSLIIFFMPSTMWKLQFMDKSVVLEILQNLMHTLRGQCVHVGRVYTPLELQNYI